MIELLAMLAVIAAAWLVYEHRDGFAFAATTVTIAACVLSIFVDLYPNVMVSTTNHAYNLTVHNTASGAYSLKAMTVVVIIFLPLVLDLPGLDLLRVPQAGQRQRIPADPPAAAAPSRASPAAEDDAAGPRRDLIRTIHQEG